MGEADSPRHAGTRLSFERVGPAARRPLPQDESLAPAIRQFLSVGVGDRIIARSELAQENAVLVRRGAALPRREAAAPPIQERVDPDAMLREMQRQLHLATVRHAPLKGIGALEDAADVGLIVGADRLHHLAVDDVMRKVRAQPHFGDGVEQQQGREKVVGDAVAMRLELDRNAFLVGNRHPSA